MAEGVIDFLEVVHVYEHDSYPGAFSCRVAKSEFGQFERETAVGQGSKGIEEGEFAQLCLEPSALPNLCVEPADLMNCKDGDKQGERDQRREDLVEFPLLVRRAEVG